MTRVYKYTLAFEDAQTLEVPRGSHLLSVEEQGGQIVLYAAVTAADVKDLVDVFIHGTGHRVNPRAMKFVGTVKLRDGALMFHVFEGPRKAGA